MSPPSAAEGADHFLASAAMPPFLKGDQWHDSHADRRGLQPRNGLERSGSENAVHDRQVDEPRLQQQNGSDAHENPWIAEKTNLDDGAVERAAE